MQKKYSAKMLNNPILLVLLLFPYFKPASLEYIAPVWDHIFDILRIFPFIIGLGMYIYNRKISKFILIIILYELSLFLSTFINNGNYLRLIVSCGTVISFCMLTELCIKQNSKLYFNCIFFIYIFLVIINFIVLIIYPNGIAVTDYYYYNCNFLAIDNQLAPILIPAMALLCVYSAFYNKKMTISAAILILCISATMIITWSATGVVGWFIMIMYIMFIYKSKFTGLVNIKLLYLTFLALQICLVFLRIQEVFSFIIVDILGKNIFFTGRTEIWDLSYILIKKSPIIGYGVYEGYGLTFWHNKFYYSHNAILEVMLQGGVISLILFAILFIVSGISLYKFRDNYISGIITAAIFSMLVTMLMEAYINHIWIYGLLTIAACISDLIEQIETQQAKYAVEIKRKQDINSLRYKNISRRYKL